MEDRTDLTPSVVTCKLVRLTEWNGCALQTVLAPGGLRVKVTKLEVHDDFVKIHWKYRFWRTLVTRGTYSDEALRKLPNFTRLHMDLVRAVREGDLQEFFETVLHCRVPEEHIQDWCQTMILVN